MVHIVDDDEAVRDSLRELFLAHGYDAHAYGTAEDFLQKLSRGVSGCLITDVRMQPIDGLQLLKLVRQERPNLPCIVLTGEADVPMAVEALQSGARDFIEKPVDEALLLARVEASLVETAQHEEAEAQRAEFLRRLERLTARERDVLEGLVEGRSNKVMAQNLGISPRTVETYRANIMNKMQAESLSELVRMTLAAGGAPGGQAPSSRPLGFPRPGDGGAAQGLGPAIRPHARS
jgi:two-component system, LuxR family, response regulator FixJ